MPYTPISGTGDGGSGVTGNVDTGDIPTFLSINARDAFFNVSPNHLLLEYGMIVFVNVDGVSTEFEWKGDNNPTSVNSQFFRHIAKNVGSGTLFLGRDGTRMASAAKTFHFVDAYGGKHIPITTKYTSSGGSVPLTQFDVTASSLQPVSSVFDTLLNDPQTFDTVAGANTNTQGYVIRPGTTGILRVQAFAGTTINDPVLTDSIFTIVTGDIGNTKEVFLENDLEIDIGDEILVVFSGVQLFGGVQTTGIFTGQTTIYFEADISILTERNIVVQDDSNLNIGRVHVKQLGDDFDKGIITEGTGGGTGRFYHTNTNSVSIQKGNNDKQIELLNSGDVNFSGNVGIGGISNFSAILELNSTTKGFLLPRLSTVQRNLIFSPVKGLEIYNITTNEPEFYNGANWINIGSAAVGGANTQIQYNNNGILGGMVNVTVNDIHLAFADSTIAGFGNNDSLNIYYTGTTGVIDNNHGNLEFINYGATPGDILIKNQSVTKDIINVLGTTTTATKLEVQNISGVPLFSVLGNGQVSVGTNSPPSTSQFHVRASSSGAIPRTNSVMALEGGADAFLSILAPNTNSTGILFGNPSNNAHAGIHHRSDEGRLEFRNGGNQTHMSILEDGRIGLGVTNVNSTALLQLDSTTKGFLKPRLTTTQRDAITNPAIGLEIYNTITGEPEFYNGVGWIDIASIAINAGGASSEIQFNNAGDLGGIPTITTNGLTNLNFADNVTLSFGTGDNLFILSQETSTAIVNANYEFTIQQSAAADLNIRSLAPFDDIVVSLGSTTNTTHFLVEDSAGVDLLRVNGNGEVILGEISSVSNPDSLLHLHAGSAGSVAAGGESILTLENDGNVAMQFLTPNVNHQHIIFGRPSNAFHGSIFYNHTGTPDGFRFETGGDVFAVAIDQNQALAVGTWQADGSAALEVKDTARGFLMPRMTTAQRDLISPAAIGLEIYNLTTNEPEFYNGTIWTATGSTSVGGLNGQLQYNNNGVLTGITGVVADGGDSLAFADNTRAYFGTGFDMAIHFDGTNSIIESSATSGQIRLLQTASNGGYIFIHNSSVNTGIINRLGTNDFNTKFSVQGANQEDIFRVVGNGRVMLGTGIFPIAQFQIDGNLNTELTGGIDIQIGTPILSGVGTAFLDELEVGNSIKINNEVFTILVIGDQQHLTIDGASSATLFGLTGYRDSDFVSIHNGDGKLIFKIDEDSRVSVGATTSHESALFDINSTTRGFLKPRMTTFERTLVASPAIGLEIFNTTLNEPEFYNGSSWIATGVGAETLAQTLTNGNNTGGNSIVISGGGTLTAFGTNTQLQYNNNGILAGISGISFVNSSLRLDAGTPLTLGDNGELQIEWLNGEGSLYNTVGDFSFFQQASADLKFVNQGINNDILFLTGSPTSSSNVRIKNNLGTNIAVFSGDGNVNIEKIITSGGTIAKDFSITLGSGSTSGGNLTIKSGEGTGINGIPGNVLIQAGDVGNAPGATTTIRGGNGGSGLFNQYGGNLILAGGDQNAADRGGRVIIQPDMAGGKYVGIGTNTPSVPLHVKVSDSGASTAAFASIVFERSGPNLMQFLTTETDESGFIFGRPSNGFAAGVHFNGGFMPDGLDFRVNSLSRMAIALNGNVRIGSGGLGVPNPETQLEIRSEGAAASRNLMVSQYSTGTTGPRAIFKKARGTATVPLVVLSGDVLMNLSAQGHDGISAVNANARIIAVANEDFSAVKYGTYLAFETTPNGTVLAVEQMRISPSGDIGIGTIPEADLHVKRNSPAIFVIEDGTIVPSYFKFIAADGRNYIQSGVSNTLGSSADLHFTDMNGANDWMVIKANGSVSIGASTPNASAILDLNSITKGLMLPRWTTLQQSDNVFGYGVNEGGMTWFNTTLGEFKGWDGTKIVKIA